MGQNITTSLPLIIAEELDADPQDISIEILPYSAGKAGNYNTYGSASIRTTWMELRTVGATARQMLISAAAVRWNVPVEQCKTSGGKVTCTGNGQEIYYKELVADASRMPVPKNPPLKNVKDFKFIGKKKARNNVAAMVTGKHTYTMDVRLPGMLYAALIRSPVYAGKVVSWDDQALHQIPGFVKVIEVKQIEAALNRNAVAVIATNTWAALEGKHLLKVKWSAYENPVKDSDALLLAFEDEINNGKPAQVFGKVKNAPFVPIGDANAFYAVYQLPYLAHAPIEPVNCTARFANGKFELWGGFQAPGTIASVLPKAFGIKKEDILVNLLPMGGSFGRKEKVDNPADAMQLAKLLDKPVQMLYSRTDDMQADFYRPASLHHLSAVATKTQLLQWRHQQGIATFPGKEIAAVWDGYGGAMSDLYYPASDYQSAFYPVESPIPLGSWRSISYNHNVFVVESFMDELAEKLNIDPLEFRYNILKNQDTKANQRLKNVLAVVADKITWQNKPEQGRYRGVACCNYTHAQTFAAHAIEVSVSADKLVTIHRCVVAVDCGIVVDPDGLKAQIEGSLAWALSAAFKNEITFTDGAVDQGSFSDYQVLRMNEMPPLEIILIESGESPGGGGEPAVPSVGPALCNAIYAATGERIRTLPIKIHGYKLV